MGSIVNKYRVHEVAKDFGVSTKEITEILAKYAETPKNHMQVLEDRELSLIFEYLTQHNPVSISRSSSPRAPSPRRRRQHLCPCPEPAGGQARRAAAGQQARTGYGSRR